MAKASEWAMDAARKSACIELRDGYGVRCTDADAELDEYSFEVFDPNTRRVMAHINVTEVSVEFIEA